METAIIVFLTSFFAVLLSAMSGGGSSIITLPVFLALGMSFPLATAVQKVAAVFWVLPAAWNYLRDRKVDWMFLTIFSGIGLIGVYLGVQLIVSIPQRALELSIGVIILLLVAYLATQRKLGMKEETIRSPLRRASAYPFGLLLGFYEGIFGSGNGILLSIVTMKTRGFDFVDAVGHYFAMSFLWVLFGAILLIAKGHIDIGLMIPAILGSVAGSFIGSAYAKYKGNAFIRMVFCVLGTILGLKLVLGF